ncbi:MAG: hypothetical protein R3343_09180 [Nitriliruptorales bacterium]|nr:hypothetical protein [Nitriliruptorales bacterium]
MASDAELVARSQRGDRDAFVTLCERYLAQIYDFTARLLLQRPATDGAVRATLLAARDEIDGLDDPSALRTWLFELAHRHAARIEATRQGEEIGDALGDGLGSDQRRVWRGFSRLTLRTRATLDLHLRQGLAPPEVAAVVGADPERAADYVARAESRLRLVVPHVRDAADVYASLDAVELPDDTRAWILGALDDTRADPVPAAGMAARHERDSRPARRPVSRPAEPAPARAAAGDEQSRPSLWKRAAVFVLVLAATGALASYAAPRLAPTADEQEAADDGPLAAASPSPSPSPTGFAPPDLAELRTEGPGIDPYPWLSGGTPAATEPSAASEEPQPAENTSTAPAARPTPSPTPTELTVTIVEPEHGTVAIARDRGYEGWAAEVEATAEAFDPEGQRLEAVWRSDQMDHDLSTAGHAVLVLELPDGCPGKPLVHTVGIQVTDPDGNTAVDAIEIEVRCP